MTDYQKLVKEFLDQGGEIQKIRGREQRGITISKETRDLVKRYQKQYDEQNG